MQYKRKLFTAGLSDNPSVSWDLSQRKKAYEEYMHKWSNAGRVMKSVYELPSEAFPDWYLIKRPGGNLLVLYCSFLSCRLTVLRVPSAINRKPIEWWEIPPLPFTIKGFGAYAPDNVLAVAGKCGR